MRTTRSLAAITAAVVSTAVLTFAAPSAANADGALSTADVAAALAGVSDRLVTPANGTSDTDSIADNGTVDVRRDGTIHFRTKNAGDIVVTLPYATKAEASNGGATYRSANSATVTRLAGTGAQTLLVAANEAAPTEYPFQVSNGYVVAMPSGGLMLLDRNLHPTAAIAAPWALDANHKVVATNYAVSDTHTSFTQIVAHNAAGVKFPVTADPWATYEPIRLFPSNQKIGDRVIVYFDRFETANMAGTGAGVASALLARVGVPGWVAPIAVGVARQAAYQSGKCATLQFELFWGWLPNTTTWVRNC